MHPGKKNNLNALCERYGVDNAHRTLHGALLDAEILSEVYLSMTRGQESLNMDLSSDHSELLDSTGQPLAIVHSGQQHLLRASEVELTEHEQLLAVIEKESKGKCLWLSENPAS